MSRDDPEGYGQYVGGQYVSIVATPTSLQVGGFTKREYAAILLRVPDSGEQWLDDMIKKSHHYQEMA